MTATAPRAAAAVPDEGNFPREGGLSEQLTFLLRYAVLAPSTRNTQPWKFQVTGGTASVFADTDRWQRVADPDQRELYLSLGCALENLRVAAEHFGYATHLEYDVAGTGEGTRLAARYRPDPERRPDTSLPDYLFDAIPERHTRHEIYEPYPILREGTEALEACCTEPGIHLHLTADPHVRRKVDELITQADALQFADPAFRAELAALIGQGRFGTPWLLSVLGQMAVSYLNLGSAARQDHPSLMSAPMLGLLSADDNSRPSQVRAGQVLERVWLTATAFGICLHPISQVVQVAETKAELARLLLRADQFPQIPFRLGYARPDHPRTSRRPLEAFLVERPTDDQEPRP